MTFETATITDVGAGAGSLQVWTRPPFTARGAPLTSTVALPSRTIPMLVGGTWKVPLGATWGGMFTATLPRTAAGFPSIRTLALQPLLIVPVKGSIVGVGTGPPGVGTRTM